MLIATPVDAFRLGSRQILVCKLPDANAYRFLNQNLSLFCRGKLTALIHIDGVSTATDAQANIFDFSYTGDEIRREQFLEPAIITDAAFDELDPMAVVELTAEGKGQ